MLCRLTWWLMLDAMVVGCGWIQGVWQWLDARYLAGVECSRMRGMCEFMVDVFGCSGSLMWK